MFNITWELNSYEKVEHQRGLPQLDTKARVIRVNPENFGRRHTFVRLPKSEV